MEVGCGAGSFGTYNLGGNGQVASYSELVGCSGNGFFTQSGGNNNLSSTLYVGGWTYPEIGGSGTYNLSGNGLLSASGENVGMNGTGTFTQSGGTNNISSTLYVGGSYYSEIGGSGTYNLSGNGLLSASGENVGMNATGTFTQSGGTNTTNLTLGTEAGSGGTYNLNGGLLILSSLSQGSGSAAFNFSGGTLQASSSFSTSLPMTLGTSGGGATSNTAGYTVTLSGSLSGPGSLTLNDTLGTGTLILTASNTYTGGTTINLGTLQLGNGTANNGYVKGNILDDSTLVFANPTPQTYSGVISGNGSLAKVGSGTLVLNGSNTYSGATTVSAGTLQLSNSAALGNSSGVTVAAGASLAWQGGCSFPGSLANAGNLVPVGTNSGTLTIGGSYSQTASGALNIAINGTSASGKFNSVAISGTASLAGSLNVTLGNLTLTNTDSGDFFQILAASSLSGSFNTAFNQFGQFGIPANRVVEGMSNGSSVGQFNVDYTNNSVTLVYQPLLMLANLSNNIYHGKQGFGTYTYAGCWSDPSCGFLANKYVIAPIARKSWLHFVGPIRVTQ